MNRVYVIQAAQLPDEIGYLEIIVKLVAEDGLLVGCQGVRLHHYGLAPDLA